MLSFAQTIADSRFSDTVRDILWLIPTLQTIHILSLAILFSSVGALALASYGRLGRTVALADMARRFAPWVWTALAALLVTGAVLIAAEPVRELINWAFWIKIPLILVAAGATAALLAQLGRSRTLADVEVQARSRRTAAILILLWALVIVFGRLIAYAQLVS